MDRRQMYFFPCRDVFPRETWYQERVTGLAEHSLPGLGGGGGSAA